MVQTRVGPHLAQLCALQLQPLRGLWGWHPVAQLAERIAEGLDRGWVERVDLARLQAWSRAWPDVHPDLRAFYAEATQRWPYDADAEEYPAISAGLWNLMEGYAVAPAREGLLRRIYEDLTGLPPAMTMTRGRT